MLSPLSTETTAVGQYMDCSMPPVRERRFFGKKCHLSRKNEPQFLVRRSFFWQRVPRSVHHLIQRNSICLATALRWAIKDRHLASVLRPVAFMVRWLEDSPHTMVSLSMASQRSPHDLNPNNVIRCFSKYDVLSSYMIPGTTHRSYLRYVKSAHFSLNVLTLIVGFLFGFPLVVFCVLRMFMRDQSWSSSRTILAG